VLQASTHLLTLLQLPHLLLPILPPPYQQTPSIMHPSALRNQTTHPHGLTPFPAPPPPPTHTHRPPHRAAGGCSEPDRPRPGQGPGGAPGSTGHHTEGRHCCRCCSGSPAHPLPGKGASSCVGRALPQEKRWLGAAMLHVNTLHHIHMACKVHGVHPPLHNIAALFCHV
jgi:hypothetical protein